MQGFITINREISKHWIYKKDHYFKAWLTILLEVNHKKEKVAIGYKLYDCDRGESLLSLDSWVKIIGGKWNRAKFRRFLLLLQEDKMIVLKSNPKTTHLRVCNYDSYQKSCNANRSHSSTNNHNKLVYYDLYRFYQGKKIVNHRELTETMIKAMKLFIKNTGASIDDCKNVITRHKTIVDATKNKTYPVSARPLQELFGQKVYGGIQLIGEQYLDGGKYTKEIKKKITDLTDAEIEEKYCG